MLKRTEVERLIEAVRILREEATDKTASKAVGAYPKLKNDGSLISYGTRINWNGKIRMAKVDMWDMEQNNPDNAPDMWNTINYRDGIIIIPDIITADMAFSYGDFGWWGDTLYRSIFAGTKTNVYTPEQHPAGWEIVLREV